MKTGLNIVGSIRSDGTDREENDYYATDPRAIIDLAKFYNIQGKIWENAVGEGNLYYELKKLDNTKVYGTDLIDRKRGEFKIFDFMASDLEPLKNKFDWIITNPPYKFGMEWVKKSLFCLKPEGKLALLLKLSFLEGCSRYTFFKDKTNLESVLVYCRRLGVYKNNIKTKNSGLTAYAWFIWSKDMTNKKQPIVDWIY